MVSLQRVLEPEPPSPQASVPVELTVHKRILIEVRVRSQWRTLATASLPLALTVFSILGARLTHHLLLQLRRRATLQLCLALARLGCPRREDLLVLRISLTRDRGWLLSPLLYKTSFSTGASLDSGIFFHADMGEPAKSTF